VGELLYAGKSFLRNSRRQSNFRNNTSPEIIFDGFAGIGNGGDGRDIHEIRFYKNKKRQSLLITV
jgi:hypothetical protein